MLSFFQRDVLDEILDLIEGFPTYSFTFLTDGFLLLRNVSAW